jgi:26S proteasome regulatory subunit N6
LLDYFNAIPDSQAIQMKTLTDNIAWTKAEKRIFLKHSLETRLVGLCVTFFPCFSRFSDLQNPNRQLENQQYISALALIDTLLTELKRLDDKMILTEVHLLESRVYRGIGNFAKAKVWHAIHSRWIRSEAPFIH